MSSYLCVHEPVQTCRIRLRADQKFVLGDEISDANVRNLYYD